MKKVLNFVLSIFKYLFKIIWSIICFFPKYLVLGIMTIFGKKNYIKKHFKKTWISLIMLILSIIVYLGCVFYITRRFVQNERIKALSQWITEDTEILMADESSELDDGSEIEPEVVEQVTYSKGAEVKYADLDSSKEVNSDTVAWLWVNGTNVDYPVVQTDDNSYYLNHDFYKNSYYSGWVFADYRSNFDTFGRNTIIYAHNSLNGKMFSSLTKLLNDGWFDNSEHRYIQMSTDTSNSVWEIFSVYTIEPETYYLTTGFTDETYETFLNTIQSRSHFRFNSDVRVSDKVLTLQTCTNTGNKRIVVHAKLYRIEYK